MIFDFFIEEIIFLESKHRFSVDSFNFVKWFKRWKIRKCFPRKYFSRNKRNLNMVEFSRIKVKVKVSMCISMIIKAWNCCFPTNIGSTNRRQIYPNAADTRNDLNSWCIPLLPPEMDEAKKWYNSNFHALDQSDIKLLSLLYTLSVCTFL